MGRHIQSGKCFPKIGKKIMLTTYSCEGKFYMIACRKHGNKLPSSPNQLDSNCFSFEWLHAAIHIAKPPAFS